MAGCCGLSSFRHQTLCVAVGVNGARVQGRRCVHKRGRCLSKDCAPPPVGLTGEDVPVEQQLQDLRRALWRLAEAVMRRERRPRPFTPSPEEKNKRKIEKSRLRALSRKSHF